MAIVFYYKILPTTGTSQGLKLTLNVETDEYMSGPASGSGAFVSTKLFILNGTKIYRIMPLQLYAVLQHLLAGIASRSN